MKPTLALCALFAAPLAQAQLSGSYTIGGSSPDYVTITDAVNDLMAVGTSGNVTFNIRPGTYTGRYDLTAVPGTPAFIAFQSETYDAADVILEATSTSAADNYIFTIDDIHGVALRALTVHPLDPDRARAVLFRNGAILHLMDCVFTGSQSPSTSNYADRILVHCDQNTIGTIDNPHDVIIDGCSFQYGNEALELDFEGLGGERSEGLIIIENIFTDQVGTGVVINNAVGQFGDNVMTTSVGNGFTGLRSSNFEGGSQVRRNVFQLVSTANGCTGIEFGNTQLTAGNMINDNMITVDGPGENWGIALYNLWDVKVLHNSVALLGGLGTSIACYHLGNFADGQNSPVRDNIFANYTGGTAFRCNVAGNIAVEDHNDLFTAGATVAHVAGTDYATIAAYQAGTGDGAGDVNIDPAFPFLPDLHLNSCALDGLGQHSLLVYTDIDGDIRANPACDMGADEFTFSSTTVYITVTVGVNDLPYTLTAGNGSGYSWSTGATTQSISVMTGGAYTCAFTDVNGCAYTVSYTVVVDLSTQLMDPVVIRPLVYPVPTTDRIFVKGLTRSSTYAIVSGDGRTLATGRLDPAQGLDVSTLPSGIHLLRLDDGPDQRVVRFVKR